MSGCACSLPVSKNGNIHLLVPMPKALECSGLPFTPTLHQLCQLIQWILPLEHWPKYTITSYYLHHQHCGSGYPHQRWQKPASSLLSPSQMWFIICKAVRIITLKHKYWYGQELKGNMGPWDHHGRLTHLKINHCLKAKDTIYTHIWKNHINILTG